MSASERIDVLAVMKVDAIAAEEWRFKQAGDAFAFAACKTSNEARAAVAELIEAAKLAEEIMKDETLRTGERRRWHAQTLGLPSTANASAIRAAARHRLSAALARVQGEPHGH